MAEEARAVRARAGLARRAPQDRAHAGHQLARAEGLRQVVVAAELEPEDTVDLLVLRGEKDDRHVRAAPQPPADLGAVELRHHDVEDDEVGRLAGEALERLLAVGGLDRAEARLREREGDDLADVGVVIDDQDRRHVAAMLDEIARRAKRPGRALPAIARLLHEPAAIFPRAGHPRCTARLHSPPRRA